MVLLETFIVTEGGWPPLNDQDITSKVQDILTVPINIFIKRSAPKIGYRLTIAFAQLSRDDIQITVDLTNATIVIKSKVI